MNNTNLAVEADIYCPGVDASGNYIDKIPSFASLPSGLRCPCGTRKDKSYTTHATFSAHMKTKTHLQWIKDLNLSKSNFIKENTELKELVKNQKLIIARMEKDLLTKLQTIAFLSEQLSKKADIKIENLLDFD
jgi:hypothetical protein